MTSGIWKERAVQGLFCLTVVLLAVGLVLPTARLERVVTSEAHSILGGIARLVENGQVFLAGVILLFSVVFPIVKLVALAHVWTRRDDDAERAIRRLGWLGKWSMLDVFVVGLFVGAVRLGILAEFEALPGIYVFASAILGSMVTTHLVRDLRGSGRRRGDTAIEEPSWLRRLSSLVALACFLAGITLPLMEIEKWIFWSNEESLLGALATLYANDQLPLAALLGLFVVLLPAVHFVGLVCTQWIPRLPPRVVAVLRTLEQWAMLDVFAVAFLVVLAQVSAMASITARAGLWFLIAAAVVSAANAWHLGRQGS